MSVQIIEKNGKPEWAVIPYNEYRKLQEALEDAEDIKDIEAGMKDILEENEITVPGEITFAILEGENPVRAWREYRGMKIKELAKSIGISAAYLSQIENNKRNPTVDTLKAVARELDIEVEMLI